MLIRRFKDDDFKAVCDLLVESNVEPPVERSDFDGLCLVTEDKGEIVGCMWALVGKGTQAYLDWVAVKRGYWNRDVFTSMALAMDIELKKLGIKRYTFFVLPQSERFIDLIVKWGRHWNIELLTRHNYLFRREIRSRYETQNLH